MSNYLLLLLLILTMWTEREGFKMVFTVERVARDWGTDESWWSSSLFCQELASGGGAPAKVERLFRFFFFYTFLSGFVVVYLFPPFFILSAAPAIFLLLEKIPPEDEWVGGWYLRVRPAECCWLYTFLFGCDYLNPFSVTFVLPRGFFFGRFDTHSKTCPHSYQEMAF